MILSSINLFPFQVKAFVFISYYLALPNSLKYYITYPRTLKTNNGWTYKLRCSFQILYQINISQDNLSWPKVFGCIVATCHIFIYCSERKWDENNFRFRKLIRGRTPKTFPIEILTKKNFGGLRFDIFEKCVTLAVKQWISFTLICS